jgi:two-component system, CAI-1 autoinducer sensor kinase/phosphatase CqsS
MMTPKTGFIAASTKHLSNWFALYEPVNVLKNNPKLRLFTVPILFAFGHPLFYFVWTHIYPQAYENLGLRLSVTVFSIVTFFVCRRYGAKSLVSIWFYSAMIFFGTVFLGSWMYFSNAMSGVWTGSLCALIAIYFAITDWRIAFPGTLLALFFGYTGTQFAEHGFSFMLMPGDHPGPGLVVIGFTVSLLVANSVAEDKRDHARFMNQRKTLGTFAHELHTPLAGIRILAGALKDQLDAMVVPIDGRIDNYDQSHRLALALIEQAEVAHDMVELQLANATGFKGPLRLAKVDLRAACEEAIRRATLGNKESAERIVLQSGEDLSGYAVGPILVQVILNLLNNALEAIAAREISGMRGNIVVAIGLQDNWATITVSDNGSGVQTANLKKIFQPFFTTRDERGHGLGLSFVQEAVNSFGGTVQVESDYEIGTLMRINLKSVAL